MIANVILFAAGVAALQLQPTLPPVAWPGTLLAACALAWWTRRRGPRPWSPARWLVWGVLGFCWAGMLAGQRLAQSLDPAWEGRDLLVTGVIAELPQSFGSGQRFILAVDSAVPEEARVPGRIVLSWYRTAESGETPSLRPGDRWQLRVRLKRPHGNANPHGFDYSIEGCRKCKQMTSKTVANPLGDAIS